MSFLFYFFVLCLTPFMSLYFAGKIGAAFIKTSANIHGNKLLHSAYNHCICTKTKIKDNFNKNTSPSIFNWKTGSKIEITFIIIIIK